MKGYNQANYKCKVCGKRCRAWIESDTYKRQLCPLCLDKEDGVDYFTHPTHILRGLDNG